MRGRVEISNVEPTVDCGRYAAKAVVGDEVVVAADILREGHEQLAAAIRYRGPEDRRWRETPLRLVENDRWQGTVHVDAVGLWRFAVAGWTDHWASWLDGFVKKHAAGITELEIELEEGARLLERRKATSAARAALDGIATLLRSNAALSEKVDAVRDEGLTALLERHPEKLDETRSQTYPLWVDRERARFSAWYEMFPRSVGAFWPEPGDDRPPRSGTFATAAERLPAIAEMGFDIVYLPPIHPIGEVNRKGSGGPHDLSPGPHDPGVPWAIGSRHGGHTDIHPDLGTIEDFEAFVAEAGRVGLEVALDYAIQCAPDHPWVTEHPEWFRHRADGSIAYAENPPKKYQDIYPIDFDTVDRDGLWAELKRVLEYWIAHGIRVFRVDNPHTKALPFWEWVIAELRADHPELIFLAEAFTRPKMMQTLAKVGFNQSYTYFAWRNTRGELESYVRELAYGEWATYYRPNFWPNTPDILTEYLQTGGRPAFTIRLVLAALLSPSYGIYSGYELFENIPLTEGSEEYYASEKYRFRPRDFDVPDSLAPTITRINRIRREHTACRYLSNVWFHDIDNPMMMAFSKVAPGRNEPLLVIVNLDPHQPHEATTSLDLWQLGLEHVGPFEAHDLMTDTTYIWHGPHNYVRLDPAAGPVHVLRLRGL